MKMLWKDQMWETVARLKDIISCHITIYIITEGEMSTLNLFKHYSILVASIAQFIARQKVRQC